MNSVTMIRVNIIPSRTLYVCDCKLQENSDLLLYPEVTAMTKKKKTSGDIWPSEAQVWIISKVRLI